jgi:hypothetical protein
VPFRRHPRHGRHDFRGELRQDHHANSRRCSLEQTSFLQPLRLHVQPADLLVQRVPLHVAIRALALSAIDKQLHNLLRCCLAPAG